MSTAPFSRAAYGTCWCCRWRLRSLQQYALGPGPAGGWSGRPPQPVRMARGRTLPGGYTAFLVFLGGAQILLARDLIEILS